MFKRFKWLSVRLRTKWSLVRVQLQSLNLQILGLLRARSSLAFKQLESVDSLWNARVRDMKRTCSPISLPSSIRLLFSITSLTFIILMLFFNYWQFLYLLKIVIKTSRLISLFINSSNVLLSMLFNLLLANVTVILWFFFLFGVVFNNFFCNSCRNRKWKTKTCIWYSYRCSNSSWK